MGAMENMNEIKERIRAMVKEEFGISPKVKVLAFGGAAGKIAEYISARKIPGVKTIAVNVDERVMGLAVDKKMWLGKEVLGTHRDTAGNVNVARYVIDRSKAWILEETNDADAVIIIAVLGGGMGTGGALEAMKILKERGEKPMMAIFVLPFSLEASRREKAMEALREVKENDLGTYVTIDSDKMLNSPGITLKRAYDTMYKEIFQMVARVANFTRVTIERKFEEMYLNKLDVIVEEKYAELLNEEISA